MSKPSEESRRERRSACPVCGNGVAEDAATFPFCCDRCRLVDLGQWFSGGYTITRPIEQRDIEEGD